jgi:acetyltransferase-like isoleucine patch superfamily enzyme
MRVQRYFIMIFLFNLAYNFLPFFRLKKILLKVAGIKIGNRSYIHTPVRFFSFKNLYIGDHTTVNPNCYLDARSTIRIGNNVNVAHNTKIYTLGHDINSPALSLVGAAVEIEDDVFIFSNAMIMPGVKIGKGAVVFPGSVVVKDVAPYTVVGGNPARFIKDRKRIEFEKTDYHYWFAP